MNGGPSEAITSGGGVSVLWPGIKYGGTDHRMVGGKEEGWVRYIKHFLVFPPHAGRSDGSDGLTCNNAGKSRGVNRRDQLRGRSGAGPS